MIEVTFYSVIAARTNAANKIDGINGQTASYQPYGEFDILSPILISGGESYYDGHPNVARIEYYNRIYIYSVTYSSNAQHLTLIRLTLDALSTAYYNDCIESQYLLYAPYSDASYAARTQFDARRTTSTVCSVIEDNIAFTPARRYVLIISSGAAVYSYLLSQGQLLTFYQQVVALADRAAAFLQSVVSIRIVDYEPYYNEWLATQVITLYNPATGATAPINIDTRYQNVQLIGVTDTPYVIDFDIPYGQLSVTQLVGTIKLHIPFVGDMAIVPATIATDGELDTIGVSIYTDILGATYTAVLRVNGAEIPTVRMTSTITSAMPVLSPSLSQDWASWSISTGGQLLLSGGIAAAGIALAPTTAGASVAAGIAGLASVTGAGINAAASATSMQHNYDNQAAVQNGNYGSNPSTQVACDDTFTMRLEYYPYIDGNYFTALLGVPHYNQGVVKLSGTGALGAGYYQTMRARLRINGLPLEVIRDAERLCDAGFYLT